jgi:hypothetical protein
MYEEVELEAPLEPTPEDHDDYDEDEAPEPESDSPDSPGWGADYAGEDENPKAAEDGVVCTPSRSRSRSRRRRPRSRPRRRRRSHSPKAVQKKQKKRDIKATMAEPVSPVDVSVTPEYVTPEDDPNNLDWGVTCAAIFWLNMAAIFCIWWLQSSASI